MIEKKICWSFQELKRFCFDPSGKIYLALHSYELMAVLWTAAICFHVPVLWLGLLYGMSVHLLVDQLTNTIHPLAYFWFYRARLDFPKSIFFYDSSAEGLERARS